jgi:hypothetical protein
MVLRERLTEVFRRWSRGEESFEASRLVVRELRDVQQECIDSLTPNEGGANA